jgi:uncharacterized DUF497 family protein
MIITWDDAKRFANLEKHDLDFADLTEDFFLNSLVIPARPPRFTAIGPIGDVSVVVVVFAPLGSEAIAIVSMRPASRAERASFNDRQTRE